MPLDADVHLVLCSFGRAGLAYIEADPAESDASTIVRNLLYGQYGHPLRVVAMNASTDPDFDGIFATLVQRRADALIIGPGPFFAVRSEQLAALTVRHAVPTIFQYRRFAAAGGLMSYGRRSTPTS